MKKKGTREKTFISYNRVEFTIFNIKWTWITFVNVWKISSLLVKDALPSKVFTSIEEASYNYGP